MRRVLDVGINTYVYADLNPLIYVDPAGQQIAVPLPPIAPPSSGSPGYKTMQDYSKEGRAFLNLLGRLGKLCFGEADCEKQLKNCRQMCLNIYVKILTHFPGKDLTSKGECGAVYVNVWLPMVARIIEQYDRSKKWIELSQRQSLPNFENYLNQ